MRLLAIPLALGLLSPALARPAAAVESLVGTYEAKVSCKGLELGVPTHSKRTLSLRVIDIEAGVVELDFLEGAERQFGDLPFYVVVTPEAAKPEQGSASGVICNTSAGKNSGAMLTSDVTTKVGSDKVTLKGTLQAIGGDEMSLVCQLKAKRVSAEVPALTDECAAEL